MLRFTEQFASWYRQVAVHSDRRSSSTATPPSPRRLHLESLELRAVLAAVGSLPVEELPQESVESAISTSPVQPSDPLEITAVHLRIGDRMTTVTSNNDVVALPLGSRLDVIGIDYQLHSSGGGLPGVVAFEGYLRKLPASGGKGSFDYKDGRFGAPATRDPLQVGDYSHGGLDGGWDVETGWDRISLAMVRYAGSKVQVEDRFFINLEVQIPDFVIGAVQFSGNAASKPQKVGKQIKITGQWENVGQGRYFNYAEVDIYHESNLLAPVWVGTLSGTAEPGQPVKGEYSNQQSADAYDKRWRPQVPGTYLLKFYADPEKVWPEINEGNNILVQKLFIQDNKPKVQQPLLMASTTVDESGVTPAALRGTRAAPAQDPIPLDAVLVDQLMAADLHSDQPTKPLPPDVGELPADGPSNSDLPLVVDLRGQPTPLVMASV